MKYLLVIMGILEFSDGVFTDFAVNRGLVNEANSLMESFITGGDFIALKIIGAVISSICLWLIYKRFPRVALSAASAVIAFYSAVMIWNTGVFL